MFFPLQFTVSHVKTSNLHMCFVHVTFFVLYKRFRITKQNGLVSVGRNSPKLINMSLLLKKFVIVLFNIYSLHLPKKAPKHNWGVIGWCFT